MNKLIYLDYNATTPIDPRVATAMQPTLTEIFGNPSSSHQYGREARNAVQKAREQVAALLQCAPEEIVFTSGGSESNNFALKGIAFKHSPEVGHIITSQIEHPAVIEVCRWLEKRGHQITYLPVDEYGRVNPDDVAAAITPRTILISIMHANNEVGTIQPLSDIASIAKAKNIPLHTDAAQSVGKIPVHVDALGVDLLTVAGHKLYAPKGIGALYIRPGVQLEKLIHGADHEHGRRAGTENIPEIVGLGQACELARQLFNDNKSHMKQLRDRLQASLQDRLPNVRINGHPEHRLPNTLSISFADAEATTIVAAIQDEVAVSAGAACHSDSVEISAVLDAMGVPLTFARGTLRLSTGRMTTAAEVDRAVEVIVAAILRNIAR